MQSCIFPSLEGLPVILKIPEMKHKISREIELFDIGQKHGKSQISLENNLNNILRGTEHN